MRRGLNETKEGRTETERERGRWQESQLNCLSKMLQEKCSWLDNNETQNMCKVDNFRGKGGRKEEKGRTEREGERDTSSEVFWMKREWSARTRNRSSSRGFPSWDHLIVGAGVPETSQTRVVGWPTDVKTFGSPTSRTGAAVRGEGTAV